MWFEAVQKTLITGNIFQERSTETEKTSRKAITRLVGDANSTKNTILKEIITLVHTLVFDQ